MRHDEVTNEETDDFNFHIGLILAFIQKRLPGYLYLPVDNYHR